MSETSAAPLAEIFEMLFHSGGQDLNDIYMLCDRYHIYLGGGGYLLFKFAIDDLHLKEIQCPVEKSKRFYVLAQLKNELETVFFQKCLLYLTIFEGHVLGLIIYPRLHESSLDSPVILQHVKHSCITAAAAFSERYDLPLYGAISQIYFGPERMPEVYHKVSSILEYSRFTGGKGVYLESEYTQLERYSAEEVLWARGIARQLANAVVYHDRDALQLLLAAEGDFTDNCFPSMEFFWYRAQNVLSFMAVELHENGVRQLPLDGTRLYQTLHCARSYADFKNLLVEQLFMFMKEKQELTERRIEVVRDYVHTHMAEYSLSVSGIARAFDVSQPYLSAQFKKYCGCNLSDYIHMVRTEEAKRLIETTDVPLSKLIERIGYSSLSTFYRCFKKHQGIAPGQLRKWTE